MKKLILISSVTVLLSGCSYYTQYVFYDRITGNVESKVASDSDQKRSGSGSLIPMEGVQANVPIQGGTIEGATNAPTISKPTAPK